MKKYIEVSIETLQAITNGRRVEGSLGVDESGNIAFKAYNRNRQRRQKDRLVCYLEHGWVKESPTRIKVHESIPKNLGTARIMGVLDREVKDAKNALIEREIMDNV